MAAQTVDLNDVLATKADIAGLATKGDLQGVKTELRAEIQGLRDDLGSAVNLLMGEIGKLKAGQEEQNKILSRIVAKLDGV